MTTQDSHSRPYDKQEIQESKIPLESGRQDETAVRLGDDHDEASPKLSTTRKVLLAGIMSMTTLLANATVGATLLNIPHMARDLDTSQLAVQWVASSYTLANGWLVPPCPPPASSVRVEKKKFAQEVVVYMLLFMGRIADLYGRKSIHLRPILNSLNIHPTLCVVRALAGLGTAVALPASFGIIGTTFTEEPGRTMAFAAMALGYPVGAGPGQIVGALLADTGGRGWHYCFAVLGGTALISVLIGAIVIPKEPEREVVDKRVDWIGGIVFSVGLGLLCFSITQSGLESKGWKEPYVPAVFSISILLLIVFGGWQWYLSQTTFPPLVSPSIFQRHNRMVTSILIITFFTYNATGGWVYLTSLWYQNLKGESALLNAVHVLTAPIVGAIASFLIPVLAPRIRVPILMFFGAIATGLCCLLYAIAPLDSVYWTYEFMANILDPWAPDFVVGLGSIVLSNLVSPSEQSVAGELMQTSVQVASTTGVCLSALPQTVIERDRGLLEGLRAGYWLLAGFSWFTALLVVVLLHRVGLAKDVGQSSTSPPRL